MKLYGIAKSTCTLRLTMLLNELNVPFELCVVDLSKGEHKMPEHLARQPFGKIPALEDNGLVLFESRSIMRYLANKYGKHTDLFGGDDLNKQSVIDNWIEAEGQNFQGPISTLVYEKVFKKMRGQTCDDDVVNKNLESLNSILDVYEKILSKRDYVAGDQFSLADIAYLPYSFYLMEYSGLTQPFESHPHVHQWYKRLVSRDSWKKAISL